MFRLLSFCTALMFVRLAHGQDDGASRFPDLVRGESVEATGEMDVLFVRASGGNKYLPLGPLDVARLGARALAECPPGLSAEVTASASPAKVAVARGGSTLQGEGAKVKVRARISADDTAELGERVVAVRFPFIRDFSLANPLFRTSPGAITIRVKVWESRQALARERAARMQEMKDQKERHRRDVEGAARDQAEGAKPRKAGDALVFWLLVGAVAATVAVLGLIIALYWRRGGPRDAEGQPNSPREAPSQQGGQNG
jgi:hypothetical protein